MLPEELRSSLAEKYDLVCFENLNDIVISHTKIFKIFKQFRRDVYENQQRLVFYSNGRPSLGFLKHLQRAAAQIDVSNFFILICCDHDISQDLKTANESYGHDDVVIENFQVDVECPKLGEEHFYPYETMCIFPLMHLETTTTGQFFPCCRWPSNEEVGNINTHTIQEAFFSPKIQALRKDLAAGIRHKNCQQCWATEDGGGTSIRQLNLILWSKQVDLDFADLDLKVRSTSLRPGNVCNFKCRICGPGSSSLYATERANNTNDPSESKKIKLMMKEANRWNDGHSQLDFFSQVSNLPELINLDLYGGEPFLVKPIKKMLEDLIKSGRSEKVRLHFNTNGSIYPEDWLDLLSKFSSTEILLSIDNVGRRFEIERGGNWNEVYNNLLKFKQRANDKLKFSFFTTVNIQNILYLEDVYNLARELNFPIMLNYINDRTQHFDIDYMTPAAKKLVVDRYQNHAEPSLRLLAERVEQSPGSDGKKFIETTDQFDSWRNQKFSESHAEIYQAMKIHG